MTTTTTTIAADSAHAVRDPAVRQHIRGSSLLLAGRFLGKGTNFAVQVLIVRHLSQSDYGALAYALSIVTLCQTLATFGLDRAVTRFLPIYHERDEYGKLFGTIFMVLGTIAAIGLAVVLVLYGCRGFIGRTLISDQQALSVLLLLVFLAPIQAIDNLLVGMFAVFASPRSIFFRKHVLGPALKMTVVVALIIADGGVYFVAGGYLLAAVVGVAICWAILWRLLRQQGIFEHFCLQAVRVPWREVLAFTIPLLTSDLVYVVMHTMDVVVLERYATIDQVAALRAVQPLAMLNQLVMVSFATLFTPLASRLFAQNARREINEMYWQTAIWIAVFSFPVFVATFSIAGPVTVLAYGTRYAQSASILAVLSLGCYFHAALGFNGLTLKVYGSVGYIVTINCLAAVLNLTAILLLVPRYGALGAAAGTCGTLVVHNILKQLGLRWATGVHFFEWRYLRVYLTILLAASALWLVQQAASPPVHVSLVLAGLASLLVFRLNGHLLNARQMFPEVMRLPFVRWVLGG